MRRGMSQTRVGLAFQHDARHQARVGQAGKPALQDGFTNTFSTPAPPFRNAFHAATRFGLASYARGGIARLDGIGTSVPVMACTPSLDRRPCRHDCRVLPPAAAVPPARSAGVRPGVFNLCESRPTGLIPFLFRLGQWRKPFCVGTGWSNRGGFAPIDAGPLL